MVNQNLNNIYNFSAAIKNKKKQFLPKTFSRFPVFGSIKNQVSLFLPEYKIPSLDLHGALATNCGIV